MSNSQGESGIPQPSDSIWLFNENARNHRGVWHIIEGELKKVDLPAETIVKEHKAWKFHDASCSGREHYTYPGGYVFTGCDCSLASNTASVAAGTYKVITHLPERVKIERQDVLCHQVRINFYPKLHDAYNWSNKAKDGDVLEFTASATQPYIYRGEKPPGPTCSRCIRRYNLNSGSQ